MRTGRYAVAYSREIGDVDEGVVEAGEDASDAEDELALANLRTERDVLLWPVGRLCKVVSNESLCAQNALQMRVEFGENVLFLGAIVGGCRCVRTYRSRKVLVVHEIQARWARVT